MSAGINVMASRKRAQDSLESQLAVEGEDSSFAGRHHGTSKVAPEAYTRSRSSTSQHKYQTSPASPSSLTRRASSLMLSVASSKTGARKAMTKAISADLKSLYECVTYIRPHAAYSCSPPIPMPAAQRAVASRRAHAAPTALLTYNLSLSLYLPITLVGTKCYYRRYEQRNKGIIDPKDSTWMKRWDIILMLALIFTAVVTPVEVAFMSEGEHITSLWMLNRAVDLIFRERSAPMKQCAYYLLPSKGALISTPSFAPACCVYSGSTRTSIPTQSSPPHALPVP